MANYAASTVNTSWTLKINTHKQFSKKVSRCECAHGCREKACLSMAQGAIGVNGPALRWAQTIASYARTHPLNTMHRDGHRQAGTMIRGHKSPTSPKGPGRRGQLLRDPRPQRGVAHFEKLITSPAYQGTPLITNPGTNAAARFARVCERPPLPCYC